MNNVQFMERSVGQYCPQLPLDELVIEVNKIFHSFDAKIYDTEHPEIHQQLPPIWQEMSEKVTASLATKALRILDFGCGTGFEAQQMLRTIPASRIAAFTCYDPSPEMLEQCRKKVAPLFPQTRFCASLEEALTPGAPYTLLITNSVLHHLPDVLSTISTLLPALDSRAMWLAGHEPSSRFYQNSQCVSHLDTYLAANREAAALHTRALRFLRRQNDPYVQTARQAVKQGLFQRRPPTHIIGSLVDVHVAQSTAEIRAGRGFDVSTLQHDLQDSWKLMWCRTYNFMGPVYEGKLQGAWARSCQKLAQQFPDDGANFCTIWQRAGEGRERACPSPA